MIQLHRKATRVVRIIRNLLIDLRYGGYLGVNLHPRDILRRADTKNRLLYAYNSDDEALQQVFRNRIKPNDVLVDVGCGRGRVLNWWLYSGYRNRMIGLELDAETAEQTRRRLKAYENVSIITGNAVDHLPPEGTIFYLYNPFDPPIIDMFLDRMKTICAKNPQVTILYYSCKFIDVFRADPDWDIEVETLVDSSNSPFPPLAIITLKPDANMA